MPFKIVQFEIGDVTKWSTASPIRSRSRAGIQILLQANALLRPGSVGGQTVLHSDRHRRVDSNLAAMDVANVLARVTRNTRYDMKAGFGRAARLDGPEHVRRVEGVDVAIDHDHDLRPTVGRHRGEERFFGWSSLSLSIAMTQPKT